MKYETSKYSIVKVENSADLQKGYFWENKSYFSYTECTVLLILGQDRCLVIRQK